MKTVNEVFKTWLSGGGIFTALQEYDVPWRDKNIQNYLNLQYHGNHSGNKYISPLVDTVLGDAEYLTPASTAVLAGVVFALNETNWAKQWATLTAQYDPIENYSMTEQMTNDTNVTTYGKRDTMTDDLTHTKTGTEQVAPLTSELTTDNLSSARTVNLTDGNTKNLTEQRTANLEDERTANLSDTTSVSRYGFNSAVGVPADETTETHTGTDTTTHTGTDTTTHTGTDNTTHTGTDTTANTGTRTVARSGTDTTTYNTTDRDTGTRGNVSSGSDQTVRNYTLTRSGNIGVTTSQMMLQSERDLWVWNFFIDVVFPSIDKVIALSIY